MRKLILSTALAASLFASSCLGPNNAQMSINNWNADLTEMNWLNEVLFIIPMAWVQSFAQLGDVLIFNTMEYWGAENPISAPGEFPSTFTNGG
jgi:hypothetical protein